tara:strand:- start:24 stop:509 length:486 start_codon:yes stop_codon:yes gene_type:complete
MNINPLDILIIVFLGATIFIGLNNKFIITLKKTFSLFLALILSNLISKNLSEYLFFLNTKTDIYYLVTFLVILVLLSIIISFIIDIIIEQSNEIVIEEGTDKFLTLAIGLVKGVIILILIIFIFDTTPIDKENKDLIYKKIETKSFLFQHLINLKEILLKD